MDPIQPVDKAYEIKVRRFAILGGFAVLLLPTLSALYNEHQKKKHNSCLNTEKACIEKFSIDKGLFIQKSQLCTLYKDKEACKSVQEMFEQKMFTEYNSCLVEKDKYCFFLKMPTSFPELMKYLNK